MAKKVEIEFDIKGDEKVKGLGQEIRELTKQLRQTPEGTKEWSQIYNKIDDLKDKMAASKIASKDFLDTLEDAGGPLGTLGAGLNKVKVATQSWGAALKATGIGLIVSLIGGLVAAFSQTEGSMKKLQPLLIGMEKIFGGLVEMAQPFLDFMLDLGMKALPYVTAAFKNVYSAVGAVFSSLGKLGSAIAKLIKGDFVGAWDDAKASVTEFGKNFETNQKNFEAGAAKMTKTEKKNLEDQNAARQKALEEKLKQMDANDKLDDARMEKMKQEALAAAKTEQEKLDIEKKFAEESYKAKHKDIEDKQALYKKDSVEYKNLQAEKLKLEGDYIKQTSDFAKQQKELNDKKNKELMDDEIAALDLKKANGELKEFEYQEALYNIKKKYLTDKKEIDANEIAYATAKLAEKKKLTEEERQLVFQALQNQIDAIDRKNARFNNDFAADQERLAQKRADTEKQRDLELQAAEKDTTKQLEIRQKYADKLYNIDVDITNNKKAQHEAQIELENMYVDTIAQFGNMLTQIAGKNKKLAIAGILITQAAGVAKTIINTQEAASKIASTSTLGFLDPRAILTYVQGGISVITSIAAAKKGIDQINGGGEGSGASGGAPAGNSTAALGKEYGAGGMINGPLHAAGGVMVNAEGGEAIMTRGAVTQFAPLLSLMNQAGGGVSFSSGVAGQAGNDLPKPAGTIDQPIIKTYVVSSELTSQAEKQAKLKDLSTL